MLGRKFKSDYISKKYTGFEEGSNVAVDIVLGPKKSLLGEIFTIWFLTYIFGSFTLGSYNIILGIICAFFGIICALILFYNATEKIDD